MNAHDIFPLWPKDVALDTFQGFASVRDSLISSFLPLGNVSKPGMFYASS